MHAIATRWVDIVVGCEVGNVGGVAGAQRYDATGADRASAERTAQ